MTLVSTVGGASGPLYGTFFLRLGAALAGAESTPAAVGAGLRAGVGGRRWPAARPSSATRRCTTPGRRRSRRTTRAAGGRIGPAGVRGGGRGRRGGPGRGDPARSRARAGRATSVSAAPDIRTPARPVRRCCLRPQSRTLLVIGIVVVSHSRALAEAAVGLADEMVAEDRRPRIEVAAGLDATTFGTDAAAVSEAIETGGQPGRRTGAARPGERGAQRRDGAGVRRSRAGRAGAAVERAAGRRAGRGGRRWRRPVRRWTRLLPRLSGAGSASRTTSATSLPSRPAAGCCRAIGPSRLLSATRTACMRGRLRSWWGWSRRSMRP